MNLNIVNNSIDEKKCEKGKLTYIEIKIDVLTKSTKKYRIKVNKNY